MLREIKTELGFESIELGHGIGLSLIPGVQKMFDSDQIRFSSLHNFCPMPAEAMVASTSLASRRFRLIQAKKRSTTHRRA